MKLLEEKTHLDLIYISFHADQHNRMNSVLQYSLFREGKNQNERNTRLLLLLHSTNGFFFHFLLLSRQESYFKLHSTSWRRERASGGMKAANSNSRLKAPDMPLQHCLCSAEWIQPCNYSPREVIFSPTRCKNASQFRRGKLAHGGNIKTSQIKKSYPSEP